MLVIVFMDTQSFLFPELSRLIFFLTQTVFGWKHSCVTLQVRWASSFLALLHTVCFLRDFLSSSVQGQNTHSQCYGRSSIFFRLRIKREAIKQTCFCFFFSSYLVLKSSGFYVALLYEVAKYELVDGLPEAFIFLLHVTRFTVFILVFAITLYNLILRFLSNFRPLWAAWRSWRFFVKSWSHELCNHRPHIFVFKLYNVSRNSTQ